MPGVVVEVDPKEAVELAELEELEEMPTAVPEYGFVVAHQRLDLDIDFSTQTVTGWTTITILPQKRDFDTIRIHARQCAIGKVVVEGVEAEFDYEDPMKSMDIPKYVAWGAEQHEMQKERIKHLTGGARTLRMLEISVPRNVRIQEVDPFSDNAATPVAQKAAVGAVRASEGNRPLSAAPTLTPKTAAEQVGGYQPLTVSIEFATKYFRDGLHFVGLSEGDARYPYVYTRHSLDPGTASCIFPCVDDPAMRTTWEINIKVSRSLGDALKRKPVAPLLHKLSFGSGLVNALHGVKPEEEEYEIPLSEDEKILEMVVVCSGELLKETADAEDISKKILSFDVVRAVTAGDIAFAIGPFEQVDLSEFREDEDGEKLGQSQALAVLGYCLPGRSEEVRHTCAPMAHAVDYFTLNFGAYPFPQYSLVFVDDQVRNTEHASSMTLCSARLLLSEDIIDPEIESVRTLVHAAAAQWFGVGIVPNERVDRWITIGLSHFMAGLFMKALCGNNEYAFRQKILTDQLLEQDVDRPSIYALGETLNLGVFEDDFMVLKSQLVLFILDKRIIKASGSAGLTRVLSKLIINGNTGLPEDSVATTKDFRRMIEKVTKYRQTEPFWNQWIYGAGCPGFLIEQKFNKKRLVVEMTITQKQCIINTKRKLSVRSFPRELKEELHGIYAGEVPALFTGPMTIRIHEADGTPYEHIVEITEQNQKIEIPYNTKYKRLKRSRRQKERINAGAPVDIGGENGEDALYYSLGDVLQTPQDAVEWDLGEFDADTEARMENESFEWLRLDADFEWLCRKEFKKMPAYMYTSQLQQDRDVVAQHESMVHLAYAAPAKLVSTFLIRTLMDTRYFHGIRTYAAKLLSIHAKQCTNWVGLTQLEKAYHEFFCYEGTKMPRTNDFSDKRAYWVENAIPESISRARGEDGKTPPAAQQILLDMLRFNDNGNNEYSDFHKVANLLSCLATSLIPGPPTARIAGAIEWPPLALQAKVAVDDAEREKNKRAVLDELDRYRRMDEWINSYQNIYTTTVLDAYRRLMSAKIIPLEPLDFVQYLHDGTLDLVRIKAFEALIDLGFLTNDLIAKLLLNVLSTDNSPFTRNHLFEVFCMGLAKVAFGEGEGTEPPSESAPAPVNANGDDAGMENGQVPVRAEVGNAVEGEGDQDENGGLIVQEATTEARKLQHDRTTTMEGALVALKAELKSNVVLKHALWSAIQSSATRPDEQLDLIDICGLLYDAMESMIVKLRLPRYWGVKHRGKGVLLFKETLKVRQGPRKPQLPKQQKTQPSPASNPPAQSSRLQFNVTSGPPASGSMRPPKRPHPGEGIEERPAKRSRLVTIKVPEKIRERIKKIQDTPPCPSRPTPSPGPKFSPRPSPALSSTSASTVSASPAPPVAPKQAPAIKFRKPLPGTPGSSVSADIPDRKPLPGTSGRNALPDSSRTPIPATGGRNPLPLSSGRTSLPAATGRNPLPDSSTRNPLPDSGRRPLPGSAAPLIKTEPPALDRKPSLKIKLSLVLSRPPPSRSERSRSAVQEVSSLAPKGIDARSFAARPPGGLKITREMVDSPSQPAGFRGGFAGRGGVLGFRGRGGPMSRGRGGMRGGMRGRGGRGGARGRAKKGSRERGPKPKDDDMTEDPYDENAKAYLYNSQCGFPESYSPTTSEQSLSQMGTGVVSSSRGINETVAYKLQVASGNVAGDYKHARTHLGTVKLGSGLAFFEDLEQRHIAQKGGKPIDGLDEAARTALLKAWVGGQYIPPKAAATGDVMGQVQSFMRRNETYLPQDMRKLEAKLGSLLPNAPDPQRAKASAPSL
ncbi:hypothetical protein BJ875DRAFT_488823 [Amylocarpus encephaloides]|uniref:Transcription initiation factor TFIID subunit 2 n=1 Tax=Amylocarpus encephaloides TaxID=45428 RepID=A0A9P8C0M3_9HELO|nr:hypothetical protein BJ875DRAFT_488823 [Amylocarpus encephaloides]